MHIVQVNQCVFVRKKFLWYWLSRLYIYFSNHYYIQHSSVKLTWKIDLSIYPSPQFSCFCHSMVQESPIFLQNPRHPMTSAVCFCPPELAQSLLSLWRLPDGAHRQQLCEPPETAILFSVSTVSQNIADSNKRGLNNILGGLICLLLMISSLYLLVYG